MKLNWQWWIVFGCFLSSLVLGGWCFWKLVHFPPLRRSMKGWHWWAVFFCFLVVLALAAGCFLTAIRIVRVQAEFSLLAWMLGSGFYFIWLAYGMGQYLVETARSQ